MTKNIERGDTFIVENDKHRGRHFTCVGKTHDGFYAGDTNGNMWRFQQLPNHKYEVKMGCGMIWEYRGRINEETIISE